MSDSSVIVEPKSLSCMVTTQIVGGHEFTVLYDGVGNKYLKLIKFDALNLIGLKIPDLETGGLSE